MLNYTLGTVPALAAWSDGTFHKTVTYPVTSEGLTATPYRSEQFPDGALGHVHSLAAAAPSLRGRRRTRRLDRRRSIALQHRRLLEGTGGDRVWTCPNSAYSTSDPHMRLAPDGLRDLRDDGPVDRDEKLTFSVNIGACMRHSGIDPATVTTTSAIYFTASSDLGDAAEGGGFSFLGERQDPSAPFAGTWRFATGSPGTRTSTGTCARRPSPRITSASRSTRRSPLQAARRRPMDVHGARSHIHERHVVLLRVVACSRHERRGKRRALAQPGRD